MSEIQGARRLLGGSSRIVCFSGAGLSAESGVATFRDRSGGGLWSRHDPMRLASPEGFAADPEVVIEWYAWRRRTVAAARPNPAHHALARRDDIVNVTQNIDDLLKRAGAKRVIQLHGDITIDRCHEGCGYEEPVDTARPPPLRNCPRCGGKMRPGVVWFGEPLPMDAWLEAERCCRGCDAMLVVGTSAVVYPSAGLIETVRSGGGAVIVINTEPSAASGTADIELLGPAGEIVPQIV